MSNVNIKRAVENIRTSTTVYTPIVETVVNAIEAIEAQPPSDGGRIAIRAQRSQQIALDLDAALRDIAGFQIEDNGIGFTDENRNSFDTLYSDYKAQQGGKGFGRFICMKYFDDLNIDSTYEQDGKFKRRRFSMGQDHSIVTNETIEDATATQTGSIITLNEIKTKIEKTLPILARNIVEKLLPYFITTDYACPRITISESDGGEPIVLNDYVTNELKSEVKELSVEGNAFTRSSNGREQQFIVRVFKFYSPKHQKSKISLVAHKREVSDSQLHDYIPEFSDEFFERNAEGVVDRNRNYIVKAYVFSSFLDATVSLERGDFRFQKTNDLEYGISQYQIEHEAALIAKQAIGAEITTRQDRSVIVWWHTWTPWRRGTRQSYPP